MSNLISEGETLVATVTQPKAKKPAKRTSRPRQTKKKVPTLGIYRASDNVVMPTKATEQSACLDVSAFLPVDSYVTIYHTNNDTSSRRVCYYGSDDVLGIVLNPGERALLPTGLIYDIPVGYSVRVHPRSGLSLKKGLTLINGEGIIDSDYVQQGYLPVVNHSQQRLLINDGMRCAQIELVEDLTYDVEQLSTAPKQKTSRSGGFGHTGA